LAALKEDRTVNELASKGDVDPTLIHGWKKQLQARAESTFADGAKTSRDTEGLQEELYELIGRLKMDWSGMALYHQLGALPVNLS